MSIRKAICLGAVLMLVAMTLHPSASADVLMEKPNPQYQDYWQYKVNANFYGGLEQYMMTGTRDVTRGGERINCYVMKMTGSGDYDDGTFRGNYALSGTMYYSVSDFAQVMYDLQVDVSIKSGNGNHLVITNSIEYGPVFKFIDFPLTASKKWNGTTDESYVIGGSLDGKSYPSQTGTNHISFSGQVVDFTNVTVPAGTFETTHVIVSGDFYSEIYLARDVGFSVKMRQSHMGTTAEHSLVKYRYEGNDLILGIAAWMFYLIVIVLILVVIVVAMLVHYRRKRKFNEMLDKLGGGSKKGDEVVVTVYPRSDEPPIEHDLPRRKTRAGSKVCPKCGKESPSSLSFCINCGSSWR